MQYSTIEKQELFVCYKQVRVIGTFKLDSNWNRDSHRENKTCRILQSTNVQKMMGLFKNDSLF